MDQLDSVFELFTRERRRYALYYLDDADGPVPVEDLATAIERWERDQADTRAPVEEYSDVEFQLKHTDLPKAATVEFVEYDTEAGEIELSGEPAEFSVILSVAEAIEQPEEHDDGVSALL